MMKRWIISLGILAFCCVSTPASAQTFDSFEAMVNGKIITVGDVVRYIRRDGEALALKFKGADLEDKLEDLYNFGLEKLISRQLIITDLESQGIQIPPKIIQTQLQEDIRERFGGNERAFRDMIKRESMTVEEYRTKIREDMIFDAARSQRIRQLGEISPRDVRKAYEKDLDKFSLPARCKFRRIGFKYADDAEKAVVLQKMNDLRARLLAIPDSVAREQAFTEAAETLGEGPEAKRGGDSGAVETSMLSDTFRNAINGLGKGQISEPFISKGWVNMLRLEEKAEAEPIPFEVLQPRIEKQLRLREEARLLDEYIASLRKKYPVNMYTDSKK